MDPICMPWLCLPRALPLRGSIFSRGAQMLTWSSYLIRLSRSSQILAGDQA